MPRHLEPPPLDVPYRILCPYCKAQNSLKLSDDLTETRCPSCNGHFRIFIATVRAKRGRASYPSREYVIRTITHSGEDVLRFADYGYSDLDLRSRDIMYVCYKINENGVYDNHPSILCNVTINKYTDIINQDTYIKSRKSGCFIATVTCGYGSWEVIILSSFRDNTLSKSKIGFLFIRFYYRISPYLAFHILKRKKLKKSIRRFIIFPTATLTEKLFRIKT